LKTQCQLDEVISSLLEELYDSMDEVIRHVKGSTFLIPPPVNLASYRWPHFEE